MNFTRVDELSLKLKAMRPLSKAELKRLRDEFIIEGTYDSNAIEGSSLTLRETAMILKEGITIGEKPIKDHLEAIGHRDAFEYVMSLADTNTPLTDRVIKDIHALVLMNDRQNAGAYRQISVSISGALHTPPSHFLVQEQLTELLEEYEVMKCNKHIIEAAAEFHLRFEGIHPFIDGNGRTGRLILNLELIKAGLLPVNIKYAHRRRYYDCFDEYYGKSHSAQMLVSLIEDYEVAELERYIDMLSQ